MSSMLKALQRLSPEQRRLSAIERLTIRRGDSAEIEALYRMQVFQDMPDRVDRAEDLFNLIGTSIGEGMYICGYLNRCLHLPGDVCEFGVAQGATSRLIAGEIRDTDKSLWLFDSFEGLPEPSEEDELIDDIFDLGNIKAYRGQMRCSPDEVRSRLAEVGFPESRQHIREGWIEERLSGSDLPERVMFAYVDFDFYSPILTALRFLDERMHPGSVVIVDDYGFFSSGAQKAVDEFVESADGRWRRVMPLAPAGKFCILLRHYV